MVDKETIIKDINKFIYSRNFKDYIRLFDHLCDIKDFKDREFVKQLMHNDSILLNTVIEPTLIALEQEYKINRISDKNNILIIVY